MIVSAGDIESFDFAKAIGIGLEQSAIRLTELVLKEHPKSITFVGSAGSYGKYDLFDLIETSSATQIEHSFLSNNSYSPIENKIVSHETDVIVNSSNYITTNENISKKFLEMGIDLENMEFYSVLKVTKYFNIPANGIFIVTNYCNKDANKDFITNHKRAMKILKEEIRKRF